MGKSIIFEAREPLDSGPEDIHGTSDVLEIIKKGKVTHGAAVNREQELHFARYFNHKSLRATSPARLACAAGLREWGVG